MPAIRIAVAATEAAVRVSFVTTTAHPANDL
jgi:hypothetical protein